MNSQEQLIALLSEGNPIPDPHAVERERVDTTTYLATLKQRSSDMTKLDTRPRDNQQQEHRRRRFLTAVAAAAAVVLLGVVIFLAPFGAEETPNTSPPTTTEAPTTTSTTPTTTTTTEAPPPTTEAPPTTVVDPAALDGYWQGTEVRFLLEDGEYSLTRLDALLDAGTYEILANDRIVLTSGPEVIGCSEGSRADFQYTITDGSSVEFAMVFNDCPFFATMIAGGPYSAVAPFEVPTAGPSLVGRWGEPGDTFTLVFGETDYQVTQDGEVVDEGTYAFVEDRVELTTATGSWCAPGDVGAYVFFWDSFDGDVLALAFGPTIPDPCDQRTSIATFPYPPLEEQE